jgi:RNA polymerase sigma-70 factor (ECF subfamily)
VRAESTIRISDEVLMVRVQDDDVLAFAELYRRHLEHARGIAGDICRDPGTAEEAVQDGFSSIWRSRDDYRPQLGSFKKWSMQIVHNRAVDCFRAIRGRPRLQDAGPKREPVEELDSDSPFESAIAIFERARMFDAIRRLPGLQAEVIVLSFYGGFSQSEIAIRLGIPTGTVKGRMRLGLEKLRHQWLAMEGQSGR